MKRSWMEKNNWVLLEKYREKRDIEGLVALATITNDIGIVYEILQTLYQNGELEAIHSLYAIKHQNQDIIKNYLPSFYQHKCLEMKENMKYPMTEKQRKRYEQQLGLMMRHMFSTRENAPTYGSLLADLFLQVASASSLCAYADLLLNSYPEKRDIFKQFLIQKNDLAKVCHFIEVNATEEDYDLVCYAFHQIEPLYEILKQDHTTIPKEYGQVDNMMQIIQRFVILKNKQKIETFEEMISQKGKTLFGITKEFEKPYIPVLSMITILPVSGVVKEQLIMHLDCDEILKEELLTAYQSQNQRLIQKMDVYYALLHNPLKKQTSNLYLSSEEEQIRMTNENYLKQMKFQKENSMLTTEDVVGALNEAVPRPVFGLFQLIAQDLPLEELYALTLNLRFETAEMRTKMYIYLKNCKELENVYSEEIQNLDVLYVKYKAQYKKMLKEKSIKSKIL